jgi:tetratricopeptide (TPR) repeat protein
MSVDARADAVLPLEEIVARDPATALYLPLVERLTLQGRLDEAVRLCEERRTRSGRGVGDHIVLGRAYLAQGRLAEARAEFDAALDLDRENVVALKALGGIFSHEGNHEEAAGYYRAVCRVDPSDLESQTALHQIASGEFPEARPADVIVGQGGLTWQPIRLPREEEHLSELALGLRTIDSFGQAAAPIAPTVERVRTQVSDAGIEVEGIAPRVDPPPPADRPNAVREEALTAPMETGPDAKPVADLSPAESVPAARRPAPVEKLPPVEMPVPKAGRSAEGNRAAFETWLRQLTGREGQP